MKHSLVLLPSLIILLLACQPEATTQAPKKDTSTYRSAITSLHTVEGQEAFLLDLFRRDQEIRLQMDSITQTFGYQSEEWMERQMAMYQQDSINLIKTEIYLETFGYPSREQFSELAVSAPWAVIHHWSNVDDRIRLYPLMRKAWDQGKIDAGQYSFFLSRTYQAKYGEDFRLVGKFWPEQKIDTLEKLLGLLNE